MIFRVKHSLSFTFAFLLLLYPCLSQQLMVEDELAFSTVTGKESEWSNLMIRNSGTESLLIQKLVLQGKNAILFNLRTPVTFPLEIAPAKNLTLSFSFKPEEGQEPGIIKGELLLLSNDPSQKQKLVNLYGLVTKGLEGENEPALSLILEALGYAIDVGGTQLSLGDTDELMGDEVAATLFKKARENEPVTLQPVARYSPKAPVPFGYYYRNKRDQLRYRKVGTLSDAYQEHQTLFPRLITGETMFDPKETAFGLFTSTTSHIIHTEFNLNTGIEHAVRVYPLKDRQGTSAADNYLVCFEEANNGDYQDFVFIVKNIKICAPAGK